MILNKLVVGKKIEENLQSKNLKFMMDLLKITAGRIQLVTYHQPKS